MRNNNSAHARKPNGSEPEGFLKTHRKGATRGSTMLPSFCGHRRGGEGSNSHKVKDSSYSSGKGREGEN